MDWEDIWATFAISVACLLVILLGCFAMADKKVRGYYLQSVDHAGICVVQSTNWDTDNSAFCSPDIDKVLDVLAKANASLQK